MENIIIYIIAPVITGLAGWFANSYRNKQKEEADSIEVARQYKELLADALEDKRALYAEMDKLRAELQELKAEIAAVKEERSTMRIAISRAAKCQHVAECPVMREIY